ncbi:primosomal protein N' [Anaerococcus degeneri]|uniref:Replication restart protein PriA n=1 Tax=Anaerococcus degeneri TaxID=361500 RepID=A0ABS7YZV1_9FIRM|nr:primosomal protein N' [Anaerococcus degeneri]MBP2015047.1 primosomal protein N' (replication factor Y) [Anaerococcus degeneri]MCA2097255.1 primosomal protein N' [Anaerococcus degeneri]
MYAKVIIDSKSRFLNRSFTYHIPEKLNNKLQRAMRVLVPFGKGNKTVVAFVYEILGDFEADYEIKDIISIIDENKLVSDELLDLAFFMSKEYLSPIQLSFKQVLPPTSIDKIKTFYLANSKEDNEILNYLQIERSKEEILNKFPNSLEILNKLVEDKKLKVLYEASDKIKITYDTYIKIKNSNIKLAKNAKKQKKIIDYLKYHGQTKQSDLLKNTSSSLSSLRSLIEKDIVEEIQKEANKEIKLDTNRYDKHSLNEDQEKAFKTILSKDKGQFLLFGVTGSGKTEIFLQVVEEVIKQGKEAIILVPEISLTPQTIERFSGRFNEKIAIIHSRLTPKEKFNQWMMIKNGEVKIAIGARSAIFAPFDNLGAIIIDEEHDNSYISSKDPKYHTREIAKYRAFYHSCKLIMASATPSIETMKEVKDGKLDLLHLRTRVNNTMPDINLVDMREELKNSNYSMLSYKLQEEIRKNLSNKEQTILFLNKIGHDSFTFCRACGYVVKCEACDVAMTYHKNVDKLVCHYCGRTKNQVRVCPNCHSKKIKEFGAGTEKLEEEVRQFFPDANIFRMDSMIATNKAKYDHMYRSMKEGKIDILLGTQMIAKGLDFENVTLVGIISADLSLNVGDFSAQETSFQLLTQVAGRAGRANKPGRAIIQTYKPENFVIQAVKENDYESFFANELKIREAFSYPPFKNIITIKIINENRVKTIDISREFTTELKNLMKSNLNVEIIGPNPCKISRINNKYRYNILVKVSDKDLDICRDVISRVRNSLINKYNDTSFIVALNPVNIN